MFGLSLTIIFIAFLLIIRLAILFNNRGKADVPKMPTTIITRNVIKLFRKEK
jgi:hypothetical protein